MNTVRPLLADVSSARTHTGTWRVFRPVVDRGLCTKCAICWKYCPDVSINLDGEGFPVIDYEHCKGCGICETECAPRAITMERG